MRRTWLALLSLAVAVGMPAGARAQDDEISAAVRDLVQAGKARDVETALRDATSPVARQAIAQAWANYARRQREGDDRNRAFELAGEKYVAWIDALKARQQRGNMPDGVRLAAAYVEYGNLLLAGRAGPILDELEITLGQRGDTKAAVGFLTAAQQQYDRAGEQLQPLEDDPDAYRQELWATGTADLWRQARLDRQLNLGWANYYRAKLEPDELTRNPLLADAEREFQALLDSADVGQMLAHCRMALGMVQRAQDRLDSSQRNLRAGLEASPSTATAAQIRYELARTLLAAHQFDEARSVLRPLLERDPRHLQPEDLPARFYINLAHIWRAYSYLLEAEYLRAQPHDSTSEKVILTQVLRDREEGLTHFRRLAEIGGPWPGLVQIYVASSVNLNTPPRQLSPLELLYTAGVLLDARRYSEALQRLEEAAGRPDVPVDLLGDIRFEQGRALYQLHRERDAAEVFETLASEQRSHPKALQAATLAFTLWGQVAEKSQRREDYAALAATLKNLLESYADHPQRDQAEWLLPVALQLAGEYDEAAARFERIPANAGHAEEARYRAAVCRRLALDAQRTTLPADAHQKKVREVAAALCEYADGALTRAQQALRPADVQRWSAEARLSAAELLVTGDERDAQRALELLDGFAERYPGSDLLGRVLSLQIRANLRLSRFDQAAELLQAFLNRADSDAIGATLATLAAGLQDEVQRLLASGADEAARKLAADSVTTFTELERWVQADPARAGKLELVQFGRARMHYLAGQYGPARDLLAGLLQHSPQNGNYRQLWAEVLTAAVGPDSPHDQLAEARDAWAPLLSDPAIRQRAPQRYWEARYHWLQLTLWSGDAQTVQHAIGQDRVWHPELGGPEWQSKFEALEQAAAAQLPATQPAE